MMPHIYEFDWAKTAGPRQVYLEEADMDQSIIKKILHGKFFDPLLSSEDEDAEKPSLMSCLQKEMDNNAKTRKKPKIYVPGLLPKLPHPRLSTLTKQQHYQCLKVLCAKNYHVLPQQWFKEPNFDDYRNFETIQEMYEKEQKEYKEWAKTIWVSQHCRRAMRPNPTIEKTYDAEFKVRLHRLHGFPTNFHMVAHIRLECLKGHHYNMQLKETLIPVNLADLPVVELPSQLQKSTNIMREYPLPEPCHKHPCQFILPNEDAVSMLPLGEVQRELAALAAGARVLASEAALRCLLQRARRWSLPLAVVRVPGPDGKSLKVVVLDSEFSVEKEPATLRTYRAFKHLLEDTFIPPKERERAMKEYLSKKKKASNAAAAAAEAHPTSSAVAIDVTSDDDSELLVIAEKPSSDDDDDTFKFGLRKFAPRHEKSELSTDSEDENDKVRRRPKRAIAKRVPPPEEPELSNRAKPVKKLQEKKNKLLNDLFEFSAGPSTSKNTAVASTSNARDKASERDEALGDMRADAINDIIGVGSGTCKDRTKPIKKTQKIKKQNKGFMFSAGPSTSKNIAVASTSNARGGDVDLGDMRADAINDIIGVGSGTAKDRAKLFGAGPSTSKNTAVTCTINARDEGLALGNLSVDAINDIIGVHSGTCTDPANSYGACPEECERDEGVALGDMSAEAINDIIGVYSCTCKDTPFEVPPPRSFVKWSIENCDTCDTVEVIVHCAHKARAKNSESEVILEPIPEYQLELGGSEQTPDSVRGVVLALLLRENATVVNVRVDAGSGDVVRLDEYSAQQFLQQHAEHRRFVTGALHSALQQLLDLEPGHYGLYHEPIHGANAMLHVAAADSKAPVPQFDGAQLAEPEEDFIQKAHPTLSDVLLPMHKYRHILPCAFTVYPDSVIKQVKKPPAKQKPPPQAIKWPKKKKNKKKKKQHD